MLINISLALADVAELVGDSRTGHMPGSWAISWAGAMQEANDPFFTHIDVSLSPSPFPSPSFSPPLSPSPSLSKNQFKNLFKIYV